MRALIISLALVGFLAAPALAIQKCPGDKACDGEVPVKIVVLPYCELDYTGIYGKDMVLLHLDDNELTSAQGTLGVRGNFNMRLTAKPGFTFTVAESELYNDFEVGGAIKGDALIGFRPFLQVGTGDKITSVSPFVDIPVGPPTTVALGAESKMDWTNQNTELARTGKYMGKILLTVTPTPVD